MNIFSQQLQFFDNSTLNDYLKIDSTTKYSKTNVPYQNYDVFVFEYCDGTLSDLKKFESQLTLIQSKTICKQLLEGLQQVQIAGKCHNDLKPDNIFYKVSAKNGESEYEIKIGDFGTADRSGGTPGWTWPRFIGARKPGLTDGYSVGLLLLYVMCDSRDVFYRLRDNYLDFDTCEAWLDEFREDPLIDIVLNMMNGKLSVEQCIERWDQQSKDIEILTEDFLRDICRVPRRWLEIQDNMDKTAIRMADATLLEK